MGVTLEVCVDTAEGLDQALRGGADRVELCSALALGGLTPSPGLMRLAARAGVPVMAMVRPRAGGFVPGPDEMAQMEADIAAARAAGLAGVVFGASLPDGRLDLAAMARLVAAAQGMEVVLHRAFDLCPDPDAALEQAVALGVTRILTSGGQARAEDGLPLIARLIARAAGRIGILPGSGITPANVGRFLAVGAREIHASCAGTRAEDPRVAAMGFGPAEVRGTEGSRVAALKAAIAAARQA